MQYLRLDELLRLRTQVAQRDHIEIELMNQHRLMAALVAPRQTAFGAEAHPTLADKAAAIVYALVQGHPFWDGNKRVATLALLRFLELNGAELQATDHELRELTHGIALGNLHHAEIRDWLEPRIAG